MPTYSYVIKDEAGNRQEDNIKAASYEAAVEVLRRKGAAQIVSVREIKGGLALDEMSVGEQVGLCSLSLAHADSAEDAGVFYAAAFDDVLGGFDDRARDPESLTEERNYKFKKILVQVATDLKKGYALSGVWRSIQVSTRICTWRWYTRAKFRVTCT
ncbi:MAG: hypothetical protein IPG71_06170 [bacterium]|nr:hypothetical protein [bacterium]